MFASLFAASYGLDLCKIKTDDIVVALNATGDGGCIAASRYDWFPEEMYTLSRVHVPIDELIQRNVM